LYGDSHRPETFKSTCGEFIPANTMKGLAKDCS
jgi:hypothetical protein